MRTKQNNKLAFSLIELSVVILVIGILVIGITKGSRIISEAKIKYAMALAQASPTASGVASDSVASIFYDSTTASIGNSATGLQNLDIGEIFTVGTSANDTGGLYNFNGMISELLVFNRPLKSVEIATIQSYLSQKYNIKLS